VNLGASGYSRLDPGSESALPGLFRVPAPNTPEEGRGAAAPTIEPATTGGRVHPIERAVAGRVLTALRWARV